ncbi:hypothetical protein Tco_0200407 [Tanacetum coccineum]
MADNRTMAELLQAPTEGYEDAIVIPEINANFELKHGLINLVQNKQFFGHDKEDPHAHIHTFYNALNANDQDSLNSTAGGNVLDKMPRECLRIIESKSKVRNSRNKAVVAKVSSNSFTPGISSDVAALTTEVSELKNMIKTMLIDKQKAQAPAPVKAVEQSCVTYGGAHSYRNYPATDGNVNRDNIQEYVSQAAAANFNQGNTNPRFDGFEPIQPPSQVYQPSSSQPPVYQAQPYQAPTQQMQGVSKTDFENYVKANDVVLRNMQNQRPKSSLPSNTVTNPKEDLKGITTKVVFPIICKYHTIPTLSPRVWNVEPSTNQSRRNDEKRRENADEQKEKFYEIFKDMSFEISFMDALTLMPKFASTLKALIGNKEKLSEMARTPLNEHCSAVILNKLPKKLGDPGRFLIPCKFPRMDECLALADLGASINLMPFSVWKKLNDDVSSKPRHELRPANILTPRPMCEWAIAHQYRVSKARNGTAHGEPMTYGLS